MTSDTSATHSNGIETTRELQMTTATHNLTRLLVLLTVSDHASAFQPCPGSSQACASVLQLFVWLVFPTTVIMLLGWLSWQRIQHTWLRAGILILLFLIWSGWCLAVLFAFNAWLANCTASCWYKP